MVSFVEQCVFKRDRDKRMRTIAAIGHRRIFNSHVEPTTEYSMWLSDGSVGRGASPQGETIGIYEDKGRLVDAAEVVSEMRKGDALKAAFDQGSFDRLLGERIAPVFGKNTCYALSLAFFNASKDASGSTAVGDSADKPRLCCNILNGGWHAYTNPVLSNFPEYLLVAKSADVDEVIGRHADIQRAVQEALAKRPKITVGGNPVTRFATVDDRECVEFLLGVCSDLGLSNDFELMIDASAGDLWRDDRYHLELTDGTERTSEEMAAFWLDLLDQYQLGFLEDPFRETDTDAWARLVSTQSRCRIIGDNFYSSDAARIRDGAGRRLSHGVIIKPNQAGTVSATHMAIEAAQETGQLVISSHRSISTESCLLSELTCAYGVDLIKIGPLFTDYSSVLRLNQIVRFTTDDHAQSV